MKHTKAFRKIAVTILTLVLCFTLMPWGIGASFVYAEDTQYTATDWNWVNVTLEPEEDEDSYSSLYYKSNKDIDLYEVTMELVSCTSNVTNVSGLFLHGPMGATNGQLLKVDPANKSASIITDFLRYSFDSDYNEMIFSVGTADDEDYKVEIRVMIKAAKILGNCNISLDKTQYTYAGKAIKPNPTITFHGTKLIKGTDYTLEYRYDYAEGRGAIDIYAAGDFLLDENIFNPDLNYEYKGFKILKGTNPLKLTAKKNPATVKYSALKKKAQTLPTSKLFKVENKSKGKLSYKLSSVTKSKYKSYFKVNSKTGKLTIKKGLKKGTYKIKVKVTSAKTTKYKSATKTVTFKVKVK